MSPAPLSKVINLLAELLGKHPVADRPLLVNTINGTLEMLYRTPALMNLYFKEEGCAVVQNFHEHCRTGCLMPRTFMGVAFPPGVQNIREINANGMDYELTNARVYPWCAAPLFGVGGPAINGQRPRAEQMPPRLLERDIPWCQDGRRVTFHSEDCADCNMVVGVKYLDFNGTEQREDIVLSTGPMATSYSVAEFLEIVFPERKGWMKVSTEDGFALGRYHPSILVPQHEWFKLETGCCNMKVQWRGLKQPSPLVFDSDMVPFSDNPLWRLALKAWENLDSMELTGPQNQGLARIYAQLAAVSDADMDASKKNFTRAIEPMGTKAALATGRAFSGQNRLAGRGRPWTQRW